MASPNIAPQYPTAVVGETQNYAVSFDDVLDAGESLTGTPTVAEVTTTDLTITNKGVSTAALTINDVSVAAGRAVQFSASGFKAATLSYTIRITASTNSTPARVLVKKITHGAEAA